MVRNAFHLVFVLTLAAVVLIVTGLMGYDAPARLAPGAPGWGGTWSDQILVRQVALGVVFLVAAGLIAVRINRRLAASQAAASRRPKPSR